MQEEPKPTIAEFFGSLPDPRMDRTRRHKLIDILTIALCGAICGADTWVDIELFGQAKEEWFKTFLELPNGIPSHDTFGEVFARLDPEAFQQRFVQWVQAIAGVTAGQVVAIDGKTVRRSHDRTLGKAAIHMVNVWSAANGLSLGQRKVDDKSNEITAIPLLVRVLDLAGCVVTIDALGCQTAIAHEVVEAGADYVLTVKENQGHLHEDVRDLFEGAEALGYGSLRHTTVRTVEKGHGRIETRQCWALEDERGLAYVRDWERWPGLRSVVKVWARREQGGEVEEETRYFISTLPGDAGRLLSVIRTHWGIENELHWVLDMAFREDESRVRKDHGPENLAVLRQVALNLLKRETSGKHSIKSKRLKAGWREDYLLKVLSSSAPDT